MWLNILAQLLLATCRAWVLCTLRCRKYAQIFYWHVLSGMAVRMMSWTTQGVSSNPVCLPQSKRKCLAKYWQLILSVFFAKTLGWIEQCVSTLNQSLVFSYLVELTFSCVLCFACGSPAGKLMFPCDNSHGENVRSLDWFLGLSFWTVIWREQAVSSTKMIGPIRPHITVNWISDCIFSSGHGDVSIVDSA